MSNQITIFKESDLQKYIKEVSKIQLLTEAEEKELVVELYKTKSIELANKLVVKHLPLVVKIAYSYKGYGMPIMDLISEGNMGLIRALKKFDYTKGFRFSTYAMWWVKAYITDYILNSWSMVKSTTLYARKKLFFSLAKIKNKLGIQNSAISDNDAIRISKQTGMSKKDIIDVNNMLYSRDFSLQAKLNNFNSSDQGILLGDVLSDDQSNPEETYIEVETVSQIKQMVSSALKSLNDRERAILTKRYIIDKPLSLAAIGKELNISRERVRQIESSALKKAKKIIVEQQQY